MSDAFLNHLRSTLAAIVPVETRTIVTLRSITTVKASRPGIAAFATRRIRPLLAEFLVAKTAGKGDPSLDEALAGLSEEDRAKVQESARKWLGGNK